MATNICASHVCMMVGDISSMPQIYICCQKRIRFSSVSAAFSIPSPRENKISQTSQTLGLHIYSANEDIPRLWHDISRFSMHFLDKNILPTNTENARFVYILDSSDAKPEDTQNVLLIQPLVEHHQIVW